MQKIILKLFIITAISFYLYGCSQELEKVDARGPAEKVQVKKRYQFLDYLGGADITTRRADYVAKRKFIINDEWRWVLFEHTDSEVVFKDVLINENAELEFGIGINQSAWDKQGDGVLFELSIVDEKLQSTLLFTKYIDPKNNVKDRKWFDEKINLNTFAGQKVSFIFKTNYGPKGDRSFDWSGWSSPQITSIDEKTLDEYPINFEKTKYDLIKEFPRAEIITQNPIIKKSRIKLNSNYTRSAEEREAILTCAPSEFVYDIMIPSKAYLEFGIGVAAESVNRDVKFEVYLNKDRIFSKDICSTNLKVDVQWFDEKIDLSKYGGKKVKLRFKTTPGPLKQNSMGAVMAGWSNFRINEVTPIQRKLSSKTRPNVILIVIDTLRADHLTCYDYNRDTSPILNKFAQKGIVFDNAISQSSWTWPSTATIMTGLYPYTHGVSNDERNFLDNSVVTIQEILQENHFTSFGISANPLITKDKNFHQGFETFIEMPQEIAEQINHKFVNWLDSNHNLQFFAYLHYMDPHDPYRAPGVYYNMFDQDYESKYNFGEGNDVNSSVNPLWQAINFGKEHIEYNDRDIEHLVALYDGEIRYWDSQFHVLLEKLQELNILDKTIIVVTSDHGEEFLDHGKLKHGLHLYDESVKVPLIIWFPEMTEGERIEEQVEIANIYPTLCKMLGIQIPKDMQGKSLFPWTEVKSLSPYAYSQTEHAFILGKGRVMKNSIRTKRWKLIHTPSKNEYELYSLLEDKGEENNLFGNHSVGDELRNKLEHWILTTKKEMPGNRQGVDKETMEKLRSLGYIN